MCFQEYSNDILFRLCLGLDNKSRDERVKYVATFLKEWNCQQSSEAGSKGQFAYFWYNASH